MMYLLFITSALALILFLTFAICCIVYMSKKRADKKRKALKKERKKAYELEESDKKEALELEEQRSYIPNGTPMPPQTTIDGTNGYPGPTQQMPASEFNINEVPIAPSDPHQLRYPSLPNPQDRVELMQEESK